MALISARLLSSKVSGLLVKELRVKFSAKKAGVSRVMLPPCPSAAKAKISLSSKAIIESAVNVMSPPFSAPLLTLVFMSLFPVSWIV